MAKPITEADLDKYRRQLIANDYQFAIQLDALQRKSFPKRLKNISEWSEAEKLKRVIIGLTSDNHGISSPGGGPVEISDVRNKLAEKLTAITKRR